MKRVKLSDITEHVRNGKSIKNSSDGSGLPITRIETISDGTFNEDKLGYGGVKDLDKIGDYWLQDGDILMSHINSPKHLGKAALYKKNDLDIIHGMNLLGIRPQESEVLPEYLHYYFLSNDFDSFIKSISNQSVNQASFAASKLKKLEIPLPSLSEQKTIVAKLDRAQRLIDIDRKMLAKYDELIQSVFLEMFGDPVRNEKGGEVEKLGDLCGVGSSKRVYVKELVEEGIPFYRGQEIGKLSEGKVLEPELFITEDHYQKLIDHSGKPEIGDLLMPSICPDGRIFIVKNNKKFYFKDGRVLWVKAGQSDINSFYLRYHLKALFQANYSEIASGTTFAELKIFALKKIQILNPPIELQERFQSEIERINLDIYRTKLSLKKSDDLFSSLVQGVFG